MKATGFALASDHARGERLSAVPAMRITLVLFGLACSGLVAAGQNPTTAPVQRSRWRGFERLDFEVAGRPCLLVTPKTPAPGRPWIWRAEFFDHEPQTDLALLERGWHVAYMDAQNMYGGPAAMALFGQFYAHLVANYSLAPRVVLVGKWSANSRATSNRTRYFKGFSRLVRKRGFEPRLDCSN